MRKNCLPLLTWIIIFISIALSGCQKHEHVYGEWVVTSDATCTAEGVETRMCECGDAETRPIKATGHSYGSWEITTAATCTEEGVEMRTCECGDAETRPIAAGHSFGEWVVTIAATCTKEGIEARTCSCGEKETQLIPTVEHTYGNWKTTQGPTCTKTGVKTRSCTICKTAQTQTLPKTSHRYNSGKVTTAATCTTDGVKTYTCTSCKSTKTEAIPKLGHKPNSNNICTRCGEECPIDLNMTASEIADAKKVEWISERDIDNLEDEQQFRLMFSLKDENENWLKVPVVVTIKITNNDGKIVYKATKIVRVSDYSGWTNGYGKQWTAAAVYIPYSDIEPSTSDAGTVSFEVYNDYVSFDTSTLTISSGLPLKSTKIILPSLPKVIHDYYYDDRIDSSVKITNITYEVRGDDLYFYFTGEKTYDAEGNNYSQSCKVGWKLYDSDGYIVSSGTFYSPNIAVGEKFRDEKEYAWDVIKPGETYTLKISSVD